MRPAKQARLLLKRRWQPAITVQCIGCTAVLFLLVAERLLCRWLTPSLGGYAVWAAAALAIIADLLLTSPLRVGQSHFYRALAGGSPEAPIRVWHMYRHGGYRKTVSWRLGLWLRRAGWTLLFGFPAAAVFAYAVYCRQTGLTDPLSQMLYLLSTVTAAGLLIAALIVTQLVMLRYMPAQYLLAEEPTAKAAFRRAKQMMKGKTGEAAGLYLGFSGWLFACLFGLPYFYAAPLFFTTRAEWVARNQKV